MSFENGQIFLVVSGFLEVGCCVLFALGRFKFAYYAGLVVGVVGFSCMSLLAFDSLELEDT